MTTLTLRDFISQLQQASPDARVVFKIECEDKNFDASLEFSRVTCLSPATEVVVTMADNAEDVRNQIIELEQNLGRSENKVQRIKDRLTILQDNIANAVDEVVQKEIQDL